MTSATHLNINVIDVQFGHRVKVIQPSNLYGCKLGDDVFIGPFVEIQSDVRIGARTKIQSHSFVCSLVSIGEDCFIGHGVMFVNDKMSSGAPAGGDKSMWKATQVGCNVSIGSNSTIMPVRICDGVLVGAGSVVTKDINSPGIYVGNPAKKLRGLP